MFMKKNLFLLVLSPFLSNASEQQQEEIYAAIARNAVNWHQIMVKTGGTRPLEKRNDYFAKAPDGELAQYIANESIRHAYLLFINSLKNTEQKK